MAAARRRDARAAISALDITTCANAAVVNEKGHRSYKKARQLLLTDTKQ